MVSKAKGAAGRAVVFLRPRLAGQVRDAALYLPHAGVVFAAALGVWAFKKAGIFYGDDPLRHGFLLLAITVALAPVKAAKVAMPLRIVHRTVFSLFAVYALAAYPAVSDYYRHDSAYSDLLLSHGRWAALIAAIAAWFRPGFGLIPVMIVAWKKHLLGRQFGFPLNATDYYPVAELALFLTLAIGVAALAEAMMARSGRNPAAPGGWSLGEAAFLGAFAIHIANYFFSAIAKITLPGANFLTWVLENETHYIMMATWVIGLGPLQSHELLALAGHEFMARFQIVTNFVTFFGQLAALVCIVRIRWAVVLTGFYDLMHAIIFVTTSILFWKWMTLNLGLILALRTLAPRTAPPLPLIVMTMGVTLLAPMIFNVAFLGWFDTAALNRPSVEAVTAEGRRIKVPTSFFLEGSAEIAKSAIGRPFEGHFDNIGIFGKALHSRELMRAANQCALPVAETSGLAKSFSREPKLERYFIEHHRFILSRLNKKGRFPYTFFPHHSWSNPALYKEFAALDLRTVVAYRYIIDSVCLSYRGKGVVDEDIRLRGVHEIRVR